MKKHIITSKTTITDEQIEDIMSAALQGCTYWADEARLVSSRPDEKDLYISEALTHGCKVRIHDAEEEKWHLVSLTGFLKALAKTPNFDYEGYDSLDAEQVLQTAIFGEAIYG